MRTFKDNAGRTWTLALDVWTVKQVRDLLAMDLLDLGESPGKPSLLVRLISDPVLLVDVIYAVCRDQAAGAGISDEQFGRAMAGDAIEQATTAVLEELVDFFPSRRRIVLRKAMDKLRSLESVVLEAAQRRLDSPLLEQRLKIEMDRVLNEPGEPSGASPGSSDATPAV